MLRAAKWLAITAIVAVSVAELACVLLTRNALVAARETPSILCLEAEREVEMRRGAVPLARKDSIVAKSANFAMGTPKGPSLPWEARGVVIHTTYRTLWPQQSREAIYEQIASRMRRCSPRKAAPVKSARPGV